MPVRSGGGVRAQKKGSNAKKGLELLRMKKQGWKRFIISFQGKKSLLMEQDEILLEWQRRGEEALKKKKRVSERGILREMHVQKGALLI